jgi:hypothetical protein
VVQSHSIAHVFCGWGSEVAQIVEDTAGKTRDLPISAALRSLLLAAAQDANVDVVRVISGGQCAKGTCTKRTGSTRHDNGAAADLQLAVGGKRQNFTETSGLEIFKRFVSACAAAGATGIGAGIDYMGAETVHVGFGPRAVWGAGGKSANAPAWIVEAARNGWEAKDGFTATSSATSLDSDNEEIEEDQTAPVDI